MSLQKQGPEDSFGFHPSLLSLTIASLIDRCVAAVGAGCLLNFTFLCFLEHLSKIL